MRASSSESGPARPELTRAEWIIMQAVWDAVESVPEISVSELLPAVRRKREWHVSTAKTMADRLVKKGYLSSRIQGKTCYYRPTVSRDQATRRSVASFLDAVLDGAFGPLVACLADRKGLSEEDVRRLRELLEQAEDGKG